MINPKDYHFIVEPGFNELIRVQASDETIFITVYEENETKSIVLSFDQAKDLVDVLQDLLPKK